MAHWIDKKTSQQKNFLLQVKRNLQTNGFEVDNELIRETWHPVYRRNFLNKALARCQDCRRGFYIYNQGIESDVSTINAKILRGRKVF